MPTTMFHFPMPYFNADGGTGGGDGGANSNGVTQPQTGGAPAGAVQQPAGKVYSEDYVKTLRDEAAAHRVRARTYEQAIRAALGITEGDLPADLAGALAGLRTAGQQEAAKTVELAKGALLKAAFVSAAAGKVADPDDAFLLARDLLGEVEVDLASGKVTVKPKDGKARSMDDVVADLLKAKPYLAKQTAGVGGTTPPGGDGGKPDPVTLAKQIAEQRTKARTTVKDPWARS